jgi:hypothetical protein
MTMTWEGLVALAVGATAVLGLLAIIHSQLLIPMKSMVKEWGLFMRDWAGEPARDGRDPIPGVMERLNNIDGELKRNGGRSIKDTVTRIEKRLIEGDKKFNDIYSRLEALESERD